MSQQALADRLDRLGYPLDRAMVAKIENGSRGVSVDEAFGLALALDAPLLGLLLPQGAQRVRLARKETPSGVTARAWAAGLHDLTLGGSEMHPDRTYLEAAYGEENMAMPGPLNLARFVGLLGAAASAGDYEEMTEWLDAIENEVSGQRKEVERLRRRRARRGTRN
jgi:transcriptional regulator with XRE-family HTH domain